MKWRGLPTSHTAMVIAFFAITFPLWCNVFLSPPDSASYFAVPRSLVKSLNIDFFQEYGVMAFPRYQAYLTDHGRFANDWPIGTGVVWTPVYAAADAIARLAEAAGFEGPVHSPEDPLRSRGLPKPLTIGAHEPLLAPTGLSGIYRLSISLMMGAVACMALLLGRRIARDYTKPWPATAALFAAFLGTPAVFYTYAYAMMSHVCSMAAVGLLFWGWHRTRQSRGMREWALLGVVAGVMVMIRPQDIAFLSIFIVEAFLERHRIDWKAWGKGVAVAAGTALLVFSPQLILWWTLYGNPLQLPKIEEMHWLRPQLREMLFSEYHGLLSWSPVLLLVPVGIAVLWRRDRVMSSAVAIVILLQVYLNAANEIWWAGGSFGARRFVNCTVPFIVALAAVFGSFRPAFTIPVAGLLAAFNLLLMAKERAGNLSLGHYVPWNQEFFAGVFSMANPLEFFPAMMGDLAGFGWPTRLILIAGGLTLAAAIARGDFTRSRAVLLQRIAVGGAILWFALAPALFVVAATRTPRYTIDQFPWEPFRENRSLFNSYMEYGYYLLVKERPEQSRKAFRKATELYPPHPNPWRYLATLETDFFDNAESALDYAEKALDRDPHYHQALEAMRSAARMILAEDPTRIDVVQRYEQRLQASRVTPAIAPSDNTDDPPAETDHR